LLLVLRGAPAAVDEELDAAVGGIGCGLPQGAEERWIELGYARDSVIEDGGAVGDGTVSLAKRTTVLAPKDGAIDLARRCTLLAAKHWGTVSLAGRTWVLTAKAVD
jgi:hypothetical protein